jgi:hypothetical protein
MNSVFVLSHLWYEDHEIIDVVERVFSSLELCIDYINDINQDYNSARIHWWVVREHEFNLGRKDSYSLDDLTSKIFKIFDSEGEERLVRPNPHGSYSPINHKDICNVCMEENIILPAMLYCGIDPEDDAFDLDESFCITGRRAPNGHEVAIDYHTRRVYVLEVNGEHVVSDNPGGETINQFNQP